MSKNSILGKIKFVLLITFIFLLGCNSSFMPKVNSGKNDSQSKPQPSSVYYDFEDILFPKELTIIKESTVVVSTPSYTSGLIALKGRIKKNSLLNFFNNNMIKDNWNIVTQIKSPNSTILIFQKSSRWAVITIRDNEFNTHVEVGVAPTLGTEPLPPIEENASETDLFE